MKKIMFNDKYDLTQAVLDGRKTQTRRLVSDRLHEVVEWDSIDNGKAPIFGTSYWGDVRDYGRYKIGEVVAIAQSYKAIQDEYLENNYFAKANTLGMGFGHSNGWNNKMFVCADAMPHHIKITNIKVDRLQDISDEDCLKEGIEKYRSIDAYFNRYDAYMVRGGNGLVHEFGAKNPREVFARLIDKISGKGTWERNPWVFVYDFVLID